MKTIPLTQGQTAIIDDADYELVKCYKWHAKKDHNTFYASTTVLSGDKKYKTIRMHRLLLELTDAKIHVDHINGDGLDNRRENIRACTRSENQINRGKTAHNTSGFKGVTWRERHKKWRARIQVDGKQNHLGYYKTPEEAHEAYCIAARDLHGDFANTGNH